MHSAINCNCCGPCPGEGHIVKIIDFVTWIIKKCFKADVNHFKSYKLSNENESHEIQK